MYCFIWLYRRSLDADDLLFHIPTMLKSSQSTSKKGWFLMLHFFFLRIFFSTFFFPGKSWILGPPKIQRLQAAWTTRYWTFCQLTSTVLWVFVLQDSWQQLVMSLPLLRTCFVYILLRSWGLPAFCTKKNKHGGRFIVDSWEVGERSTCFFFLKSLQTRLFCDREFNPFKTTIVAGLDGSMNPYW